jgi:hypothetical protein
VGYAVIMLNRKQEVLERTNCQLSFDITWTTENHMTNNSSFVACVFFAMGNIFTKHFLAIMGGYTY